MTTLRDDIPKVDNTAATSVLKVCWASESNSASVMPISVVVTRIFGATSGAVTGAGVAAGVSGFVWAGVAADEVGFICAGVAAGVVGFSGAGVGPASVGISHIALKPSPLVVESDVKTTLITPVGEDTDHPV
eukprot:198226-Rhodomonas_salina.1